MLGVYVCARTCIQTTDIYMHTHKQLKKKYKSIMEGINQVERCRVGKYVAVYIPFKDAGTGLVREAVCLVDGDQTPEEEIMDP